MGSTVRRVTRGVVAGAMTAVIVGGGAACSGPALTTAPTAAPAAASGASAASTASSSGGPGATTGGADATTGASPAALPHRGGELTVLVAGKVPTWDPQLMYVDADSFFAQRTVVRTLTTYGTGASQRELVGDLATSTGTTADRGRTWSFTLRDNVRWQDGTDVTCADVRRGIAHTFDPAGHTSGTNYASFLLDLPTAVTAGGMDRPVYAGPSDTAHQAAFDAAVACSGPTITFRLRTPELDFPRIVALPEFAPRQAAAGAVPAPAALMASTGPYRLASPWQPGRGGTLVRNEQWDPASDPVRRAYPDVIHVVTGLDEGTVVQRLLNQVDGDASAVSWVRASSTLLNQTAATPELAARTTTPFTGDVTYLALNQRSPVMANPIWSVLSPVITGHDSRPQTTDPGVGDPASPEAGDPTAAQQVLTHAGVTTPVPIRVVYPQTGLADKAYAALRAGWERAGFRVTLRPVAPEDYYATIESPAAVTEYDVFRGLWRPDLPVAGAVLPVLFDGRINIDSSGPGQDVGYFADAEVAAALDAAAATPDPEARASAWARADDLIRAKGGYVALSATRATYVHGVDVTHYEDHLIGGIVDLATVSVR